MIALKRMRQFVLLTRSSYPQRREVWQCSGSLSVRVPTAVGWRVSQGDRDVRRGHLGLTCERLAAFAQRGERRLAGR